MPLRRAARQCGQVAARGRRFAEFQAHWCRAERHGSTQTQYFLTFTEEHLEPECLAAYVEGLAAEGFAADLDTVRRAHALHMLLFSGLSSPPLERLDGPPTDELRRWTAERAAAARFMVDLVHATS